MTKYPWQGIQIKIHPLFWGMICLAVWTGHFIEITTLFVLVIIHEMGHVTAAWSYGWTVRRIELLPFGGVATMEEWGKASAKEEIVICLAGPFHHIFMILLSYCFLLFNWWSQEWTQYFIKGNIIIATFNLIPIYPLDGGRILQALMSYLFPYRTCISFSYQLSLGLSALLIILSFSLPGIWIYPPLFFIGLFLFATNFQQIKTQRYQFLRFLLHRLNKGSPAASPLYKISVSHQESLPLVIKRWYRERYHILEVIDHQGKVLGWIPEEKALEAYFRHKWHQLKELFP